MSFTLHGLPVSGGIAIGHAHLVSNTSLEVSHYVLPKPLVNEEVSRLDDALEATRKELTALRHLLISQLTSQYPCEVWLTRNGRRVNAKSIMGVMMLAAAKGTSINVETDGEREQEAMTALPALVRREGSSHEQ